MHCRVLTCKLQLLTRSAQKQRPVSVLMRTGAAEVIPVPKNGNGSFQLDQYPMSHLFPPSPDLPSPSFEAFPLHWICSWVHALYASPEWIAVLKMMKCQIQNCVKCLRSLCMVWFHDIHMHIVLRTCIYDTGAFLVLPIAICECLALQNCTGGPCAVQRQPSAHTIYGNIKRYSTVETSMGAPQRSLVLGSVSVV